MAAKSDEAAHQKKIFNLIKLNMTFPFHSYHHSPTLTHSSLKQMFCVFVTEMERNKGKDEKLMKEFKRQKQFHLRGRGWTLEA